MKRTLLHFLTGLTIVILFDLVSSNPVSAQNVGINNPTPNTKALLDLTSSDKGLLAPRMTEAQRLVMFPMADASSEGMLVYQTDGTEGFYYYNGIQWSMISNDQAGWGLTGNSGTNPTTNFLGTTDNQPMVVKTNNTEKVRVATNGNVGIGTSAPGVKLEVRDSTWLIPMRVRNMMSAGYSVTQYFSPNNSGGHVGIANPGATNHAGNFIVGSFSNTPVAITTNDVERMRVTPAGLVGVGTTTPQSFVDLTTNTATGWGHLALTETEQDYSRLMFRNTVSTKSWEIAAMPHATDSLMAMNFYHSTNGNLMTIKGTGKVGINTFNPRSRFHVFNGSSGIIPNANTGMTLESNSTVYSSILSPGETGMLFGTGTDAQSGGIIYNPSGVPNGMLLRAGGNVSRIAITDQGMVCVGNNVQWGSYRFSVVGSQASAMVGYQNNDVAGLTGVGYHMAGGAPAGITGWANSSYGITPGTLVHGTVSNNPVTFITNFAERMRITNIGNVGIGTLAPTVKLEVMDATLGVFAKFQGTNNAAYSLMHIMRSDNVGAHVGFFNPGLGGPLAGNFVMGTFGPAPVTITSNNVERLTILPDGKVGIGTTTPALQLEVTGPNPSTTMMRIKNTDATGWSGMWLENNDASGRLLLGMGNTGSSFLTNAAYAGTQYAHPFVFLTSNAERMRITPTGDVGIRTNNPTADLEVNGFTKLGSDAPAIKMKKLTGTVSATGGVAVTLPHGVPFAKILSVTVLVEKNATTLVPPSNNTAGDEYNIQVLFSGVQITPTLSNSTNVLSKPIRVLVTYEE